MAAAAVGACVCTPSPIVTSSGVPVAVPLPATVTVGVPAGHLATVLAALAGDAPPVANDAPAYAAKPAVPSIMAPSAKTVFDATLLCPFATGLEGPNLWLRAHGRNYIVLPPGTFARLPARRPVASNWSRQSRRSLPVAANRLVASAGPDQPPGQPSAG